MAGLEGRLRRLEALEGRVGVPRGEDRETSRKREVLKRMSVEELRAYVAALRRAKAGEEPTDADGAIFARQRELYAALYGESGVEAWPARLEGLLREGVGR